MQALISIPEIGSLVSEQQATEMLMRRVAGVPLLRRTVLTAVRAGANQVLLICPVALSDTFLEQFTADLAQRVQVIAIRIADTDGKFASLEGTQSETTDRFNYWWTIGWFHSNQKTDSAL